MVFLRLYFLAATACQAVPALCREPPTLSTHLTYHTAKMYGYQPHHQNMSAWWSSYEFAPRVGAYPFQNGNYNDFAPIFSKLIDLYPDETCSTIDEDAWATQFLLPGRKLLERAQDAKQRGSLDQAYNLFL